MRLNHREFIRRTFLPMVEALERRDAPALLPAGPEFQVNTWTGLTEIPSTAGNAAGDFTIVWQADGQDGSGRGIFGQRYNAQGETLGSEFPVNSYTTGSQYVVNRSIAANSAGDFVVVYYGAGLEDASGIYARRFLANGTPLGEGFLVNTFTTGSQSQPRIAMNDNGEFIVTWISSLQDGSSNGIFAQRFDADGSPINGEIQVNTYTTDSQSNQSAAIDAAGDFVIVWQSSLQDGSDNGIFGQRFNSDGTPSGTEFAVNTYTSLDQSWSSVAGNADGAFVVVWKGAGPGDDAGIFARRFDASGLALGSEFLVNVASTGSQLLPSLASNAAGNFVVAWMNSTEVYLRSFDATGQPQGGDQLVTATSLSATATNSSRPPLSVDPNGNTVVAWTSSAASVRTIAARRYVETGSAPKVFTAIVNGGASQRSRVTNATMTFTKLVTLGSGTPANAFNVSGPSGLIPVNVDLSLSTPTQTIARLTFTGPGTEFGSLSDGNYTLTVFANQVVDAWGQALDGNGDGTPGDNYTFNFHRLFGDADGDRDVDATDFAAFRSVFGTGPSIFDFNNDGLTTAADFAPFRARFGITLVP